MKPVARANAGAPGVEGVMFAHIEASAVETWLADLRRESKRYPALPCKLRNLGRGISIAGVLNHKRQ